MNRRPSTETGSQGQGGELVPLAYRPADAAAVLGISRAKLYQLMAEGLIVGRKLDRRTLIPRAELERYLDSLPTARDTEHGTWCADTGTG